MDDPPPTETAQVGLEVRRRRQQRGWTLDTASARLGVSRRLLAQIEAGQANPSLSTLLSLAAGFDIALTDLLTDADKPSIAVQPDHRTAPLLWTGTYGGEARLLAGSEPVELWQWSLEPGDERASEAHRPGSREILFVTKGTVTLSVGSDGPLAVRHGQTAMFRADEPHAYRNTSTARAEFILAVHEPSGGIS